MTERRLERALSRAGITREQGCITWHDLRHNYGSHLAMRGVQLQQPLEIAGPSRLSPMGFEPVEEGG
jgi:site-specific recombinase XerD